MIPAPFLDGVTRNFDIEYLMGPRSTFNEDDLHPGERLLLNTVLPPWQRPSVWTEKQQVRFIESVFLGLNVGSYVMTNLDWGPGGRRKPQTGWLIDGQQRITAIRDFAAGRFGVFGGELWNGLTPRDKRRFERTPFPCIEISYDVEEEKLKDLYDRLAYGGTPHVAASPARPRSTAGDPDYVRKLEDAVLDGERFCSDPAASRRKGYSPRPLYDAADKVRAERAAKLAAPPAAPAAAVDPDRIFLVAYESRDGKPYALALSEFDTAARLADHYDGEVIETVIDNHADIAAAAGQERGEEPGLAL